METNAAQTTVRVQENNFASKLGLAALVIVGVPLVNPDLAPAAYLWGAVLWAAAQGNDRGSLIAGLTHQQTNWSLLGLLGALALGPAGAASLAPGAALLVLALTAWVEAWKTQYQLLASQSPGRGAGWVVGLLGRSFWPALAEGGGYAALGFGTLIWLLAMVRKL
jgi:hypothetical protein